MLFGGCTYRTSSFCPVAPWHLWQARGWLAELGLCACWLVHPCADGRAGGCLLCSPCDGKCGGEHLHWCVFPRLQRISGTLRTRKVIATCGSASEWPHRGRGLSVSGLPCVAGLPQASPCQAGWGYSKVSVMAGTKAFCSQVTEFQMRAGSGLPLDLRQGEEAPGLKAWRWQTGSQLLDDVAQGSGQPELAHKGALGWPKYGAESVSWRISGSKMGQAQPLALAKPW